MWPFNVCVPGSIMRIMHRTKVRRLFLVAGIVAALQTGSPNAISSDRDGITLFENRVRPVLTSRCIKCHGAAKQESGLRLDSKSLARKGGDRGPAIVPGDPEHSLLVQAARRNGDLKMPPDEPLESGGNCGTRRVDSPGSSLAGGVGAVAQPAAARSRQRNVGSGPFSRWLPHRRRTFTTDPGLRTPVDRFILARLDAERLKPVGPADKAHTDPPGHV